MSLSPGSHVASLFAAAALACLPGLASCGDGSSPDQPDAGMAMNPDSPPAGQAVTVQFAAVVGAMPFACGQTYTNLGSPAADYVMQDFRLFVHDVDLIATDGTHVPVTLDQDGHDQLDDLALLDFEDGSAGCPSGTTGMHTSITGTVPPGKTYDGIELKVGVPDAMDHLDASTATPPLDDTTMWWVWKAGYKYVRIDGKTATNNPFPFHLGATGCPGDSNTSPPTGACANPNIPTITLMGLDPTSTTIDIDAAALFQTTDLTATGAMPGCHAEPTNTNCAGPFAQLGLPFGQAPAGAQTFFHAP